MICEDCEYSIMNFLKQGSTCTYDKSEMFKVLSFK